MSGLLKSRKGQTALEVLFILSVVLLGAVAIIPTYTKESSETVALAGVRDAASQAVAYLNTGVVVDEEPYDKLNGVIKDYAGYQSDEFRLIGVKVQFEDDTRVRFLIKIEHSMALDETENKNVGKSIGEFMVGYLGNIRGFSARDEKLYFSGREVEFNVTVNGEWTVVP